MRYTLASVCCFSRWVWLTMIPDRAAEAIGKALLESALLGMAMFSAVLRSDRAPEFVRSELQYINVQLEIKHVLWSAYHPQSQGVVGRMHGAM